MNYRIAFIVTLLALGGNAAAAPVSQQGRSCHLPGLEETLRCLRLPVPLEQGKPGGEQLSLHVTIAPALRESAQADPLFVLAGGPGQAGSDMAPLLNNAFRRVRATRDIVLIDQRGTGRSERLDCPDPAAGEAASDDEQRDHVRACIAAIKRPFSAYTTEAAAHDIERVRRALGYGAINLWGGSYGTRLAQVYARRYPGAVRALVLDGVAAPDQVIPAGGQDGQAALDLLFSQCAASADCARAYPNLRAEFAALVDQFAAAPLKISVPDPRTAAPLAMTMSSNMFLKSVHSVLYSAADSRRLPFLLHTAYQGNWAPFVARRNAAGDFAADGGVGLLLHLAVTCAEDYPRLTEALRAEDGRGSFMHNIDNGRIVGLCSQMKVAPVALDAPARIAAPALMLSGALDPVTPPRRAAAAAKHFAQVQQLVVDNAGHGISMLGCAPRLLRDFLDRPGEKVNAACLSEIPAPGFQLGSAGPQP